MELGSRYSVISDWLKKAVQSDVRTVAADATAELVAEPVTGLTVAPVWLADVLAAVVRVLMALPEDSTTLADVETPLATGAEV